MSCDKESKEVSLAQASHPRKRDFLGDFLYHVSRLSLSPNPSTTRSVLPWMMAARCSEDSSRPRDTGPAVTSIPTQTCAKNAPFEPAPMWGKLSSGPAKATSPSLHLCTRTQPRKTQELSSTKCSLFSTMNSSLPTQPSPSAYEHTVISQENVKFYNSLEPPILLFLCSPSWQKPQRGVPWSFFPPTLTNLI